MGKIKVYSNFKFDDDDYDFEEVQRMRHHTEKEYRAEYARLYKVAKARVRAFEEAGMTRNAQYKRMKRLKPQSKLTNIIDLASSIEDVRRSLKSESGTASGARLKDIEAVQKFHSLGYDFVNRKNLYDFYDFLNKIKAEEYDKIYSSERMIDVFETFVEEKRDTKDLYVRFMKFMSEHDDMPDPETLDEEFLDWDTELEDI